MNPYAQLHAKGAIHCRAIRGHSDQDVDKVVGDGGGSHTRSDPVRGGGGELVPLVPPMRMSDKGGHVELCSDRYGCQPPLQERGESNGCFIVCLFKGSAGTNY